MNSVFVRVLIGVHITLLILLGGWVSMGNWVAEQQWQATVKSIEQELSQTFPPRPADATARAVQQLALKLGLTLTGSEGLPSAATTHSDETHPPLPTVNLPGVSARDPAEQEPLDEALQAYLTQHQAEISQIVAHLVNHIPRWQRPSPLAGLPSSGFFQFPYDPTEQDLVNYDHLQYLHRLLLVTGLEYARQGKAQPASQHLVAAWNLVDSLPDQSLGMSFIMLRSQAEGLRQFQAYSTAWQQRWATVRPRLLTPRLTLWPLVQARLVKTAIQCRYPSDAGCVEPWRMQKILSPITQPYFTFAAVDFLRRARSLEELDPCHRPAEAFLGSVDLAEKTALVWNSAYALYLGNHWKSLRRRLLDWELTAKGFEVRALRAQGQTTPETIPGFESSTICPTFQWQYTVQETDTVSISVKDETGRTLNQTVLFLTSG
jgi:hypothetical protein